jgi:hypothetical protein
MRRALPLRSMARSSIEAKSPPFIAPRATADSFGRRQQWYRFEVVSTAATIRIAQSMVTGNGNGWLAQSSGVVLSAGDNTIEGNTLNEATRTPYILK